MKTCPFCAEEIQDAAIVCKHCGRELTGGTVGQEKTPPKFDDVRALAQAGEQTRAIQLLRSKTDCGLGEAKDYVDALARGETPEALSTPTTKKISETKATCNACGNIWHYGKTDQLESAGAALQNAGKAMMCCTGCVPALFIPNKEVVNLDKCPKCGSKAVTKETVEHEVQ